MHKTTVIDVDNKPTTVVLEDYKEEAEDLFSAADIAAGEPVEVLYTLDTKTNEDLELWRNDWI